MNISQLLRKSAKTLPANFALVHGSKRLTYAQFNAHVNRLANALYSLGIKQGDIM